jgi:two-component system phosphate regulon response regulator PhoB
VVLRVKAVLRRLQPEQSEGTASELLQVGGIELDISGHQLRLGGKEVPLTATEFRLLRLLMERNGRVQTRGQLLSDVWGYAEDIDSRTVDTHIRRLRRKLGSEADRIETVIGVGYRLRP